MISRSETFSAETVITRLVKGGVFVSFELTSDGAEWLCKLQIRDHEVWNTGADMATALFTTMLDLLASLAQPPTDPEDA